MRNVDVAIVGGGIAGVALAAALAHDGLGVAVLEAVEQYEDRVRGESMMPWGVKEARELGVEATLIDAGAHVVAVRGALRRRRAERAERGQSHTGGPDGPRCQRIVEPPAPLCLPGIGLGG